MTVFIRHLLNLSLFPVLIFFSTQKSKAQSELIGIINVDSIVENSLIGDSTNMLMDKLLTTELKHFRDTFEVFQAEYSRLLNERPNSFFYKNNLDKKSERLWQMEKHLACMEHLALSIELLFDEQLPYFVSDVLRNHTEEVKKQSNISLIVTHKPLFYNSENEKEEIFFISLNQTFINVVQNSIDFKRYWRAFKKQILVKIAALKLNMYQHCFNN